MCDKEQAAKDRWRESDGFAKAGNNLDSTKGTGVRFEDPRLTSRTQWEVHDETMAGFNQTRSPQYTPLLVMMMIELHAFPDRRQYYLYASLPPAQTEILGLLKTAQIVIPRQSPMLPGAVQMWDVDEDALRAYVNAVCRISLPEKVWVLPGSLGLPR